MPFTVLGILALMMSSPETAPELLVEAFVAEADDPLLVAYAVAADSGGSGVTLSFTSDTTETVAPVQLTPAASGVFLGTVRYPGSAVWTVTVAVAGSRPVEAAFSENLPWPHYTTEAGHPKVKYDSGDPGREGSLVAPGESIYLAAADPASSGGGIWKIGLGGVLLGGLMVWWLSRRSGDRTAA